MHAHAPWRHSPLCAQRWATAVAGTTVFHTAYAGRGAALTGTAATGAAATGAKLHARTGGAEIGAAAIGAAAIGAAAIGAAASTTGGGSFVVGEVLPLWSVE